MATKKTEQSGPIEIQPITRERIDVYLLGTSPLVCNAMSAKVRQELLLPAAKKTAAAKAATLKHEPLLEYQRSIYRASLASDTPTRITFPAAGFKKGLCSSANDVPGDAARTQLSRLVWAEGDKTPIFGVPQIFAAVVKQPPFPGTPNVRIRAIVPRWACTVTINFIVPVLNRQTILNLLAAAGMIRGIGDGRPEKGALSYGQYEIVAKDDPRWLEIVATGGVAAQDAALAEPEAYDEETRELLDWYAVETKRRGFRVAS
jgi:hypothetical protein